MTLDTNQLAQSSTFDVDLFDGGQTADSQRSTPETPWWLRIIGLSSLILLVAALVSPANVAPLFAGCALVGLIGLRLFAMKTGWPFRPARFARVSRGNAG